MCGQMFGYKYESLKQQKLSNVEKSFTTRLSNTRLQNLGKCEPAGRDVHIFHPQEWTQILQTPFYFCSSWLDPKVKVFCFIGSWSQGLWIPSSSAPFHWILISKLSSLTFGWHCFLLLSPERFKQSCVQIKMKTHTHTTLISLIAFWHRRLAS